VLAAGVTSSLLVMLQAWVVAGLVLAVVHDEGAAGWALATVGTFAARALVTLGGDLASRTSSESAWTEKSGTVTTSARTGT
jgi:ATP-binding cassette subfamily C protein CydCD